MTSEANFVRQQGFREAEPEACARYPALMWQPRVIGALVVVGLVLQSGPYFVALGALLWWNALLPRLNPFDALYNGLVAQRRGRPRLGAAPAPRRFAQAMAGSFMLAIGGALVAGWSTLAWAVEGALVVALAALIFGRFCLGSYLFHALTGQLAFANGTLPWSRSGSASRPVPKAGRVRDAAAGDVPAILALNQASVVETSHLDEKRLALLSSQASYFRVYATGDFVAGFLLGFREGDRYENENFDWFRGRFPRFVYIDRVIVRGDQRGAGIGSVLYKDVERYAKAAGVDRLACEVNIEPPNLPSLTFHQNRGFREVGRRDIADAGKVVSMQVKRL